MTTLGYDSSRCVSWYERNGYDDSDFGAVYWNGETFVSEIVGSTRYYGGNIPRGNADENLKFQYEIWRNVKLAFFRNARENELRRAIVKGAYVTVIESVTRGKNKIAAGEAGIVFWSEIVNHDPYGREWGKKRRAGILVTDENGNEKKIYIDASRIRVQGFEDENLPLENDVAQLAFAMSYPPARA